MQLQKSVSFTFTATLALTFTLTLTACDNPLQGCRTDQDCPASAACILAECRPLVGADLGSPDGGFTDLSMTSTADFSTPVPDGWSPDALANSCTFNNDGVIARSEEPFLVGLGALFAVNPSGSTVAVNLTAQNMVWDFTAPVPSERKVFDQIVSPSGAWWSGDFPTATYAEKLDDGQAVLGVYRATTGALQLLGVVSDQSGTSQTELTYATPIDVLQFPLSTTSSWTSESDVTGLASGIFFSAHEKYVFSVDSRGTTKTPAGAFDTLRLRLGYTQTYGLLVTTRITYLHLAECYGAVARVRSQDNETSNDFTQATEYRRLAIQ